MRTRRLRVTLSEVEPVVVRVLDVPAAALLPEVHQLLQAAVGWTDSHLHQFVTEDARYGTPEADPLGVGDDGDDERDETGVPLRSLPSRFRYDYDFGDGWEHEVEMLGPGGPAPGCVAGEGPCPPEDVGGPPGYARFREAWADPSDPEHDQMRSWVPDWQDRFDLAATDLFVRQTAGTAPASVRMVLDLLAPGVRLTPGGRLPRSLVREVQRRRPAWDPFARPASVEEDVPPLSALHDALRSVGLARLRRGVLSPTRAADDEVEVVRRLRSWFGPEAGFTSLLVTDSLASLAAAGPANPATLAARAFPYFDNRWVTGSGERLTERRVRLDLLGLEAILVGLDQIEVVNDTWSEGASSRWLLPRATGLAYLFTGRG